MKVQIDGLNINYIEENKDALQTVLIVHGWGANIKTVRPIVNLLKHNYHVLAIDLPGHGESDEPKEKFGTKDFSNIIIQFINKMNVENIYYIGHSFGGKCGIYINAKLNPSIDKLVLVDASGIKPRPDKKIEIKIKIFKLLKSIYIKIFGKNNLDKFYKKFGSEDYKAASGIMRDSLVKVVNEDLSDILEDINTKTLLIWGNKDDATPLYMGEEMKDKIKDSKLIVLEGGHYSYLDDSTRFRKEIIDFFKIRRNLWKF